MSKNSFKLLTLIGKSLNELNITDSIKQLNTKDKEDKQFNLTELSEFKVYYKNEKEANLIISNCNSSRSFRLNIEGD